MKTRVISALILMPIGLVLIWIGGWPLYIALAFVFSLAALEFTQLMKLGNFSPNVVFAIAFVLVLLVAVAIPDLAQFTQPAIAFLLIAALTWQMRHREGAPVADWALAVAGGIYLGTAGEYFILLRQLPSGERWLLLALAGTWLADSGAFFVGRQIGKHKMTPGLSPKKSWEGLVGGAVIGFILNALLAWAFGLPPVAGAMLGLIGALVGTLGDLSISMVKRQVGAKDSGHIIPGHGGVLDRLDSLLFTVIVSYYFIVWFVR